MLVVLAHHASDRDGLGWPSRNTIAAEAGLDRGVTSACLVALADAGLILDSGKRIGRGVRMWQVLPGHWEPDEPTRPVRNFRPDKPTRPDNRTSDQTSVRTSERTSGLVPNRTERNGTSPNPTTETPLRAQLITEAGNLYAQSNPGDRGGLAAWKVRQLETDQANEIDRLVERMQRCADAGQHIDVAAHAARLIDPADSSSRLRLANVNPDPVLAHALDCRLCDGTRYLDSDDPDNPGVLPCPGVSASAVA